MTRIFEYVKCFQMVFEIISNPRNDKLPLFAKCFLLVMCCRNSSLLLNRGRAGVGWAGTEDEHNVFYVIKFVSITCGAGKIY